MPGPGPGRNRRRRFSRRWQAGEDSPESTDFILGQDAIAAALERILSDPGAARAMAERGRAWATRTLGWDAIGRAVAREYGAVLGQVEATAS